ncbi:STAS domain-containing protein [Kitasatospora sp. NPDC002965]|uniref:STAS domain-containing protein n=1 Tax=Kitasatospora sp. NPDC002965 TaxID=3154775 RepID=UPI0033AAF0A7
MSEDLPAPGPRPGPRTGDATDAGAGAGHLAPRLLAGRLAVGFTTTLRRPRAHLKGEIDMDLAGSLYRVLGQALARSDTGLDIDMSGVEFCDSSGLNTLIRLRLEARADDRTVTITAASPQVRRLLTITETAALFTPPPAAHHDETPEP